MRYVFADYELDTRLYELRHAGQPCKLEPQVFNVLLYLIERRERVVPKDELLEQLWPKQFISEVTLNHRVMTARKAIGDSGREQRCIKTIHGRGYRFIAEVRAVEPPVERSSRVPARTAPLPAPSSTAVPAPLSCGVVPTPPLIADRPSIAVLPFENLSEDRALEFIADGLAEDIIALLARVPGFFVIARASSFVYRQRSVEMRTIGVELGVRYAVTGSTRSFGGRVRVTVQLIEAESGSQLWAGRYDVERGDTLDLQDEITRQIIVELEPALTKAELSIIRRRRTDSVDAWSHYRQAVGAIAVHGWNEESVAEGIRQLREAIAVDANFALAHALLALLSAFGANLSLVGDVAAAEQDARQEAERAVALDPNASDVLGFAGCAVADIGEVERGHELLQRALELDPSNAQAHVALGAVLIHRGEFDRGIETMQFGMRSSPQDFRLTFWGMILANALVCAGRLDEALAVASTASRRDGRLYGARVVSAWVLTKLDHFEEARAALAEARRIRPTLNLAEIQRFFGCHAAAELAPVWT